MKERFGLKELKRLADHGVRLRFVGERIVELDSQDLLESLWSVCESGNYMSDICFDQTGQVSGIDFTRVGPPPKKRAVRY